MKKNRIAFFLFYLFTVSTYADITFEKPLKWAILAELGNQRTVQILGREVSGNYVLWTEGSNTPVVYQNRCGIEVGGEVTASFAYPFLVTASTVCRVNENEKAWVKIQDLPKAENPFSIAFVGSFSMQQLPTFVFLYNWAPFPDENDEGGSLNAIVIPLNATAKNQSIQVKTILNHIPGYSGALRLNRAAKKIGITLSNGNSLNELVSLDSKTILQLVRSSTVVSDWKTQAVRGIPFKGLSLSLDFTDMGFGSGYVLGQEKAKVVSSLDGKPRGTIAFTCAWLGVLGDDIYELCDGKKVVKTSLQSRTGHPAPGPLL